MIATRTDPLAEAAWNAHLESLVKSWGDPPGGFPIEFDMLGHKIQQAWTAAAKAVLRHWLENDFKSAIEDPERLQEMAAGLAQVGQKKGDPGLRILQIIIASFVKDLIDPASEDDA